MRADAFEMGPRPDNLEAPGTSGRYRALAKSEPKNDQTNHPKHKTPDTSAEHEEALRSSVGPAQKVCTFPALLETFVMMLNPAVFAKAYAKLSSWLRFGNDWNWTNTPIVMYLQNSGDRQTKASLIEDAFWQRLTTANKGKSARYLKTFQFEDYDYIPTSIHRTFVGKACPWEIRRPSNSARRSVWLISRISPNIAVITSESIAAGSLRLTGEKPCLTWWSRTLPWRPASRHAVFGLITQLGRM